MFLDDNTYYDPEEMESLLVEIVDIKQVWCESYLEYGCKGCKYYEEDDQVCRLDK